MNKPLPSILTRLKEVFQKYGLLYGLIYLFWRGYYYGYFWLRYGGLGRLVLWLSSWLQGLAYRFR